MRRSPLTKLGLIPQPKPLAIAIQSNSANALTQPNSIFPQVIRPFAIYARTQKNLPKPHFQSEDVRWRLLCLEWKSGLMILWYRFW